MNNLEIYQQEINVIFSCLEKIERSWQSNDNSNFIKNLKEYKKDAISFASLLQNEVERREEK